MDWKKYPNFSKREMECKHTGRCEMDPDFMARLQKLRTAYGKTMVVTSGYRHPTHPIEAAKSSPGAHSSGKAVDIAVPAGALVHELVGLAFTHGFTGIGISQRDGRPRFVHLDTLPRQAVWSY